MKAQLPIYTIVTILLLNSKTHCLEEGRAVTKRESEELDKEQRNAECCQKKLVCCVAPKPPSIEIRAVLARCPKSSQITRNFDRPILSSIEDNIKHFQGFDEDEPLIQSRVVNCNKKILISLKLHQKGPVNCKNQFIVIDHVYDSFTERSVRLLNPYVIKIKQQQVSKAFYLKFVDYVNSEAYEQIYSKQDWNYTGCYTDRARTTCGIVKYDGKPIPFSEGFCCSCDSKTNTQRQPESFNAKNEEIISYSDPAYLLDRVECPRTFMKDKLEEDYDKKTRDRSDRKATQNGASSTQNPAVSTTKHWIYHTFGAKVGSNPQPTTSHVKTKRQSKLCMDEASKYLHKLQVTGRKKNQKKYIEDVKQAHLPLYVQAYLDELHDKFGEQDEIAQRLIRRIRQVYSSGVQIRGGQNCANRYTPPGVCPEAYHESTHCLRFSDVWYGIYKLGEPSTEQTVEVNIYERFDTTSVTEKWREITNHTIYLSNRMPVWEDEAPSISLLMTTKTLTDIQKYSKNLQNKRILIPEEVPDCIRYKHTEILNGPEEYLVVKPDQIAVEGDQCDKIGVGFEAFYKQPFRCNVPKFTCLHNQPKHLWRHDKQLARVNKKGCYFLKYHANITKDPILINRTTGEKFLEVDYIGAHITNIDMEIRADFNSIIRHLTSAAITEVYVDSTCEKVTLIIIKLTNTGLLSNEYMVRLTDFPLEIAEKFGNIKSKKHLIPPQNQHVFTLEVRNRLPSDLLFCTVEALNHKHEIVALRRVRIQRFDRCVCTWHCLCACVSSPSGLRCRPMSLPHYHAAGFQGSLPITTYVVHFTLLDDLLSVAFYFLLFLLVTLVALGLTKGLMGLCCSSVGMWGLQVLLDLNHPLKRYHEPSLRNRTVVYNSEGIPIHPDTGMKVRVISHTVEFCANLMFFYTYPLITTFTIFRRCCCPYYTKAVIRKAGRKGDHLKCGKACTKKSSTGLESVSFDTKPPSYLGESSSRTQSSESRSKKTSGKGCSMKIKALTNECAKKVCKSKSKPKPKPKSPGSSEIQIQKSSEVITYTKPQKATDKRKRSNKPKSIEYKPKLSVNSSHRTSPMAHTCPNRQVSKVGYVHVKQTFQPSNTIISGERSVLVMPTACKCTDPKPTYIDKTSETTYSETEISTTITSCTTTTHAKKPTGKGKRLKEKIKRRRSTTTVATSLVDEEEEDEESMTTPMRPYLMEGTGAPSTQIGPNESVTPATRLSSTYQHRPSSL